MTKPEVMQEDRDLVVSFYSRSHATFWPDNFSKAMETCDEIKRGHCDNWELVQAVASHRQAAEQRGAERLQFLDANDAQIVLDELQTNGWEGLSIEDVKELGAVFAYAIRQGEQA